MLMSSKRKSRGVFEGIVLELFEGEAQKNNENEELFVDSASKAPLETGTKNPKKFFVLPV